MKDDYKTPKPVEQKRKFGTMFGTKNKQKPAMPMHEGDRDGQASGVQQSGKPTARRQLYAESDELNEANMDCQTRAILNRIEKMDNSVKN